MSREDISIIVPVYNVASYLEDCLESVLQQNFQNCEIICINDASTDNSDLILQRYALKYTQIKVVTHTQNQGLSAARNTGLKYAKGKYVWFVDSDDMIMPNALKELYYIIEKENIDIVYFDMIRIKEDDYKRKVVVSETYHEYDDVCSGREMFCKFVEKSQMKFEVCRQLVRREFLKEHNIKFYKGILHEDELFSFHCVFHAKKVLNVNEKYYIYRQRIGSIMSNKEHRRSESLFVVLVQIMAIWVSNIFTDRGNQAIAKYYKDLYCSYKYYLCFGNQSEKLEVGGLPEKTLFSLLMTKDENTYLSLSDIQLKEIDEGERVIVYGAGWAARDIVCILKKRNVKIDTIAVSDVAFNPKQFCGIQVNDIKNIANAMKDAVVIIGVTEKYRKEILDNLKLLGFENIVIPEAKGQTK